MDADPKSLKKMARPEGLEPPTRCFEGSCSIQLSYGRIRWEPHYLTTNLANVAILCISSDTVTDCDINCLESCHAVQLDECVSVLAKLYN
jgi:hypothetical protein